MAGGALDGCSLSSRIGPSNAGLFSSAEASKWNARRGAIEVGPHHNHCRCPVLSGADGVQESIEEVRLLGVVVAW